MARVALSPRGMHGYNVSGALHLSVKAGIYARQNLREYWVLDVDGHELHVFRTPQNGAYAVHDTLTEDATVSPLAAPHATISVADLLP